MTENICLKRKIDERDKRKLLKELLIWCVSLGGREEKHYRIGTREVYQDSLINRKNITWMYKCRDKMNFYNAEVL